MRSFRAVPEDSPWKVSPSAATFLAGGMSSNVFWIGSFPFDAVKKCVDLLPPCWTFLTKPAVD